MKEFFAWLFNTPTPFIAILSFTVAFLAFLYQRKWNRKQKAQEVAKHYATYIIPKMRYIKNIYEQVGNMSYVNKFSEFNHFTANELKENLSKSNSSSNKFIDKFNKITPQILDDAYSYTGCNPYITNCHIILKDVVDKAQKPVYEIFDRFVVDFLNELEAISLEIVCNIAEESLIYSCLHQSFLKNVKRLYFFIAKENQLDQDRYYTNIISLYLMWEKRSSKKKESFIRFTKKINKIKKV